MEESEAVAVTDAGDFAKETAAAEEAWGDGGDIGDTSDVVAVAVHDGEGAGGEDECGEEDVCFVGPEVGQALSLTGEEAVVIRGGGRWWWWWWWGGGPWKPSHGGEESAG